MHRIRLNEMDAAKEMDVPDQDEDALEENQAMTEQVMNMIASTTTQEESIVTQQQNEEDEDEILRNLLNI